MVSAFPTFHREISDENSFACMNMYEKSVPCDVTDNGVHRQPVRVHSQPRSSAPRRGCWQPRKETAESREQRAEQKATLGMPPSKYMIISILRSRCSIFGSRVKEGGTRLFCAHKKSCEQEGA